MAYNILLACRGGTARVSGKEYLYYRILNDRGFLPDQETLNKYRINPSTRRCAVVFRFTGPAGADLWDALSEIAPMDKGDLLIPVDYHSSVLIREMNQQSMEELKEYTEAVVCTMESEGIAGIKAGIGNEAKDMEHLRDSFYEGLSALSTGIKYHSRDNVYLYSGQVLDRIIDSIPDVRKQEIRKNLLGKNPAGGLSDEMLETVRVFFQNDLNLTAASRQLFIHRNTLNYRLDKIKKETGLDLRSFEDAVIFRIAAGIPDDLAEITAND